MNIFCYSIKFKNIELINTLLFMAADRLIYQSQY